MDKLAEEILDIINRIGQPLNFSYIESPVYWKEEATEDIIKLMQQYHEAKLREELQTPIEDGLYATGRFTQDECSVLAEGLLMYINEYLKQRNK